MKYFLYALFIITSSSALASSDYIIDCETKTAEKDNSITYILNIKKGIVEILQTDRAIEGVLGTDEHFYTLYFTYNKKTESQVVTTTIINRVTGELTETATSKTSYPNMVGKKITGVCKSKKYERKL